MLSSLSPLDISRSWLYHCPEPGCERIRMVTEVEPDQAVEMYLRVKLEGMPTPVKDYAHLHRDGVRVFMVDDVGVLIQGFVPLDGLIDVHIAFWDKRLRGRELLCRKMAECVAHEGGYPGVWTAIPETSRTVVAFARRVGFTVREVRAGVAVLTLVT